MLNDKIDYDKKVAGIVSHFNNIIFVLHSDSRGFHFFRSAYGPFNAIAGSRNVLEISHDPTQRILPTKLRFLKRLTEKLIAFAFGVTPRKSLIAKVIGLEEMFWTEIDI